VWVRVRPLYGNLDGHQALHDFPGHQSRCRGPALLPRPVPTPRPTPAWYPSAPGVPGRGALGKVLFAGAVELDERGFGRARLGVLENANAASLRTFLVDNVEPGSRIITDGWSAYPPATRDLYTHKGTSVAASGLDAHEVLPAVHRVFSLVKRWVMGTMHYLSQPDLGPILAAGLAEFGDDPTRYTGARARKNYAGTSPITRASGKSRAVHARHVHNDRLRDALGRQAYAALSGSPGARTYYDQLRDRGTPTTPPCASSRTASSASCTAASKPAPPTTKPPPGTTTPHPSPLDHQRHGMSANRSPGPPEHVVLKGPHNGPNVSEARGRRVGRAGGLAGGDRAQRGWDHPGGCARRHRVRSRCGATHP